MKDKQNFIVKVSGRLNSKQRLETASNIILKLVLVSLHFQLKNRFQVDCKLRKKRKLIDANDNKKTHSVIGLKRPLLFGVIVGRLASN